MAKKQASSKKKATPTMESCIRGLITHLQKLIDSEAPKEAHALKCDAGVKAAIPRFRKALADLEKASKNVRGLSLELKK